MRNFLLLKIRKQEYKHYYNMLSSQSWTEASGWHITVKNLYLGLRVFQPDMASLGTDAYSAQRVPSVAEYTVPG